MPEILEREDDANLRTVTGDELRRREGEMSKNHINSLEGDDIVIAIYVEK